MVYSADEVDAQVVERLSIVGKGAAQSRHKCMIRCLSYPANPAGTDRVGWRRCRTKSRTYKHPEQIAFPGTAPTSLYKQSYNGLGRLSSARKASTIQDALVSDDESLQFRTKMLK